MSEPTPEHVETACEVMHDAYERAAVDAGWETNPASRKPWTSVPEANKQTMRAAISALLTSTNPVVLDAMQDVLVRAGRLRESLTVAWDDDHPDMSGRPQRARAGSFRTRETANRAVAYYATRGRNATVERRLVTDWQEA